MNLTKKQNIALKYLNDSTTTEILYGGGAGGGKTLLGVLWIISMCTRYPGTRWLMGRAKLKALKGTTLKTFFEVCQMVNIQPEQYTYNAMDSCIYWSNGSEIVLKDLFAYPSDPDFTTLGGLEITGCFLDEIAEITVQARNMVKSRIRFKLDEFDLIPKIFMSCNPSKNWSYSDFYKPEKEGTLKPYRKFVQSLLSDNPHISKHYKDNLITLDDNSRERLLYGNWEYDSDPAKLMEFDAIQDVFTNEYVEGGQKYLTVDVARLGNDRTVAVYWNGLRAEEIYVWEKKTLDYSIDRIGELSRKHGVSKSRVIVDVDGLGSGVADVGKYKGFVNGSRPLKVNGKVPNYNHLKSQCYFKLAELVNEGKIYISCPDSMRDGIVEELEMVKEHNMDKDGKKGVVPKNIVSQNLGRSPDISDALNFRMYYEFKKTSIRSGGLSG